MCASCRTRKTLQSENLIVKSAMIQLRMDRLKLRKSCGRPCQRRSAVAPRARECRGAARRSSGTADGSLTHGSLEKLYQRRLWRPNSHVAALFEIDKINTLLHRSKLRKLPIANRRKRERERERERERGEKKKQQMCLNFSYFCQISLDSTLK